jgi:metallo-beta-lactamase family protein
MKITFWGAAKTVTGSMHHVEAAGKRFLLDCGTYQGRRQEANERNCNFPFPISSIDSVVLSHAHIDHSGNLPTFVRQGYTGPIYTTPATIDLCLAMLVDSAFLQEKDAEFCNRRREYRKKIGRDDRECEPLYTREDAEATFKLFRSAPLHKVNEIAPGVTYTAYEAGHMLGSSSVVMEADGVRLCFSGDVGRRGLPILFDPETPPPTADYLIMESTYGNRFHAPVFDAADKLADIVNRTVKKGGRIIMPAFAVGRTQQLVLMLHDLVDKKRIPSIPVYVDSPLAVNATEVFRKHPECYDDEARKFLTEGEEPFGFRMLKYVRNVEDSKKLNDLHGPFIVVAASGMAEGGRVLHHLRNNIEDPRNTVLITGYQAANTLGRKILERHAEVPIFGEPVRLRADVAVLDELSGHADQGELIEWMKPLAPRLKKIFLVHGDIGQSTALAEVIRRDFKIEVVVPSRGDSFDLN